MGIIYMPLINNYSVIPSIFNTHWRFRRLLSAFILLISLLSHVTIQADEALHIFEQSSYQKILNDYNHKAFILVLWSIDCPPCYEELLLLSKYARKYREVNLVFVSTDAVSEINLIRKLIKELELQQYEHWIFSSEQQRRLSYTIDPKWHGELPRSYFFIPCKSRQERSGKLTIKELDLFRQNTQTAGCYSET